jgi:hypothetical protein
METAMIDHPRTAILYYAWDLLKSAVDVGDRVYLHRVRGLDVCDLPAVCLGFESEENDVHSGSAQGPTSYLRTLSLYVDVFAENPIDPSKTFRVEDRLGSFSRQVELAFFNDLFFSKRLSTNTNSLSDPGLVSGLVLGSVRLFDVEMANRDIVCQRTNFSVSYLDEIYADNKYGFFESYLAEIRKPDWDAETVDPILISAEGDIE